MGERPLFVPLGILRFIPVTPGGLSLFFAVCEISGGLFLSAPPPAGFGQKLGRRLFRAGSKAVFGLADFLGSKGPLEVVWVLLRV